MEISESVQILLSSRERVIDRFYDRLLSSYPELRRHFEQRDLHMQASILTIALASVEAYYQHRFPATEHYLKVLGHRHYHEGVPASDFPKFQTVLLQTLAAYFGDDWDHALANQWDEALTLAIDRMREGYLDSSIL